MPDAPNGISADPSGRLASSPEIRTDPAVSLLLLTGGMGAGKSSVLTEASDLLAQQKIVHAAIDVDALGVAFLPGAVACDEVMYANLHLLCQNYRQRGVHNFLLARAIENAAQKELCRNVVSASRVTVCRLTASESTLLERVKTRETGILQQQLLARVTELNSILDNAQLEDFSVSNENRSLTEVALEILLRAGWIVA